MKVAHVLRNSGGGLLGPQGKVKPFVGRSSVTEKGKLDPCSFTPR